MKYCPNFTAWLSRDDGATLEIARARCKKWSCEHCAEINRIHWRYRITAEIEKRPDDNWSFITITARGDRRDESLADLRQSWEKFVRVLRKRHGGKLVYLRVYEKHADGAYHIHALTNHHFSDIRTVYGNDGKRRYTYSRWMKDVLPAMGAGHMCSAENLRRQGTWGIARYVTKYMTKEDKGDFPRNLRRFQTSQGFAKLEKRDNEWRLQGGFYYRDAREAWGAGRDIIDVQTGTQVEAVHFATLPDTGIINQDDAPYRPLDNET